MRASEQWHNNGSLVALKRRQRRSRLLAGRAPTESYVINKALQRGPWRPPGANPSAKRAVLARTSLKRYARIAIRCALVINMAAGASRTARASGAWALETRGHVAGSGNWSN